jgi:hypothetical protein
MVIIILGVGRQRGSVQGLLLQLFGGAAEAKIRLFVDLTYVVKETHVTQPEIVHSKAGTNST